MAEGSIQPLVVLGVSAGMKDGQSQRNTEFTCNPEFMSFVKDELLPWFMSRHKVAADPKQRTIAGSSYGGLFATFFAFNHPKTVGHVLSLSDSFHWCREEDDFPYEWLIREFAFGAKKPIDIYMAVARWKVNTPGMNPSFRTRSSATGTSKRCWTRRSIE